MKKKTVIIFGLIFVFLFVITFLIFKFAVKLNGDIEIILEVGTEYEEKGASSIFNFNKIKIEGNVDSKKIGTYEIKYRHPFIPSSIIRKVKVVDTKSPAIVLNGNSEINLTINGTYKEPGYSATDEYDGDLTDKVIVTNNIDSKKAGVYEVYYKVVDSSGNEFTTIRKVNVNEKGPLSMNLKEFNLDGYFDSTILKETSKMNDSYINETIFYGDSITENFAYYENLPWNVVWAKNSITPESAQYWKVPIRPYGEEMTLVDASRKYKPKRLIITLGANAVAVTKEDYFIKTYEDLIKKVKESSPDTLIIVQSIFPVDISWDTHANTKNSINNTKINRLNYFLAEMCERQEIKFLNTAAVLKDENGTCIKGYCYDSDGIHLLPIGNSKVIEYVKTHAYIGGN